MVSKTTTSFSFLKEALLLPTRNPKLFTPVLILIALPTFLLHATNELSIQPLTMDMLRLAAKIKNIDPSSAEYATIMEQIKHDVAELVVITIAIVFVTLVFGFAKQIMAFFAASTTYSGDRYSLPELLTKVIKGNLGGPLITIALVTMLQLTSMVLLSVLLSCSMTWRHTKPNMVLTILQSIIFLFAFLAFLYFNVVYLVGVAVSVADMERRRGMRALREAWRVMTKVSRKEGVVLVVVVHLVPTVLSPLYLVALAYVKKGSTALGLCTLSVFAMLSAAELLFSFTAVTVYYYQSMDREEVMSDYAYAKIPTSGEANC